MFLKEAYHTNDSNMIDEILFSFAILSPYGPTVRGWAQQFERFGSLGARRAIIKFRPGRRVSRTTRIKLVLASLGFQRYFLLFQLARISSTFFVFFILKQNQSIFPEYRGIFYKDI